MLLPLLLLLLLPLLLLLQVRTYNVDGENTTGVHAIDLTLAEIKTLRVKERLDFRSQAFNGFLPVMTFEECATMAKVGGVEPLFSSSHSQLQYTSPTKDVVGLCCDAHPLALKHP
jgi:hypothetical protein